MKGIDIYSGDGNVNFSAVKASGVEVVYIKATEGLTYNDPTLKSFYDGAKAAGLKVGFYHFMRSNDPVAEAKHFLSYVNGLVADCKYALDIEAQELEGSDKAWATSDRIVKFCEYLKSQGKEPVVYTYTSFYDSTIVGNAKNYPVWIARYSSIEPNGSHIGWQYSESGTVSGINHAVDLDTFTNDILLSNFQANVINTIDTTKLNQPNSFCINQKGKSPIFPPFEAIEHIDFKELPDDNSKTTGSREAGFKVNIYGKCSDYYLVNNGMPQYVKISSLKATQPLTIQKVSKVVDYNGAKCWENPEDTGVSNGTVPYTKAVVVYTDVNGYYLVNGANANLQWMNNNNQLQNVYPNNFSVTITKDSLPLFEGFAANEDMDVKEFPHEWSKTISTLKKGDLVKVYGKFDKYYLISNVEKQFVEIEKLVNTQPLKSIKQVKVINADGGYCRENPSCRDKTNGIVPVGKAIPVYTEFNGYYLVNGSNVNFQWIDKDDVEDIK